MPNLQIVGPAGDGRRRLQREIECKCIGATADAAVPVNQRVIGPAFVQSVDETI
jgi:hypothetical protein